MAAIPGSPGYDLYLGSTSDEFDFDLLTPMSEFPGFGSSYISKNCIEMAMPLARRGFQSVRKNRRQAHKEFGIQPFKLHPGRMTNKMETENLSSLYIAFPESAQVNPPRSDLINLFNIVKEEPSAPANAVTSPKKRKSRPKLEEPIRSSTTCRTFRNGKTPRKCAVNPPGTEKADDARKMSLEKNKVAAARSRCKKKEQIEQMQKVSHEKNTQNVLLREAIMVMRVEISYMNTLLLAHSDCGDYSMSEEIHDDLQKMDNEYSLISGCQHCDSVPSALPQLNRKFDPEQLLPDDDFTRAMLSHDQAMLANTVSPE